MRLNQKNDFMRLLKYVRFQLERIVIEVELKTDKYYEDTDGEQDESLDEDAMIAAQILEYAELLERALKKAKRGFLLETNNEHNSNKLDKE